MREILFRGKCFNTDEWVEGYLGIEVPDELVIQQFSFDEHFKSNCIDQYSVKPETIGQYTGLKDKNGTKIFEGDICKAYICRADTVEKEVIGTICFEDGTFEFKCEHDSVYIYPLLEVLEVIGNVFDSPELLEDKNNE